MAEPEAIQQAEKECLADAELRETRRWREQLKRTELDQEYVAEFASEVRRLSPNCPTSEEVKIAQHACRKYSGRVGRSAAAKDFDPQIITLAVQAHIRHVYTNYDDLLMKCWERVDARALVREQVEKVLNRWQTKGVQGSDEKGEKRGQPLTGC